jgi:RimJ/RimL family protein N-acetyltransferase
VNALFLVGVNELELLKLRAELVGTVEKPVLWPGDTAPPVNRDLLVRVYLADHAVRCSSGLPVLTAPTEALRIANPGNWQPVEWDELLDGKLGPWAIAVDGGRVSSICHTPRPMTERAAECGVWSHPEFRGRGHAAAVTAAWAELVRPSGRHLFYSTDETNRSSQRVAERLALPLLGWMGRAPEEEHDHIHPLSSLRYQLPRR